MDTIFALATARGKAGIAVFRLSGPLAHDGILRLCGDVPATRVASVRTLRHNGETLDQALVLIFAGGASFTGEPMAELHLHGGLSVVQSVARALSNIPGLRQAEAGNGVVFADEHAQRIHGDAHRCSFVAILFLKIILFARAHRA